MEEEAGEHRSLTVSLTLFVFPGLDSASRNPSLTPSSFLLNDPIL